MISTSKHAKTKSGEKGMSARPTSAPPLAAGQPQPNRLKLVLQAGLKKRSTGGAPDVYPALNPGGLLPTNPAVPPSQLVPAIPGFQPDFGPYKGLYKQYPPGAKRIPERALWNVLPDTETTVDAYGNTVVRVKEEGAYALRKIVVEAESGRSFEGCTIEFVGSEGGERATSIKKSGDMLVNFKGKQGDEQLSEITLSPKQLAELANVLPAVAPGPIADIADEVSKIVRDGAAQYQAFLKSWAGLEAIEEGDQRVKRFVEAMESITVVHWDDVSQRVSYRLNPFVAWMKTYKEMTPADIAKMIGGTAVDVAASIATNAQQRLGRGIYKLLTLSPGFFIDLIFPEGAAERIYQPGIFTGKSYDVYTSVEFWPDQPFGAESGNPPLRLLAKSGGGRVHVYRGATSHDGSVKLTLDETMSVIKPELGAPMVFDNPVPKRGYEVNKAVKNVIKKAVAQEREVGDGLKQTLQILREIGEIERAIDSDSQIGAPLGVDPLGQAEKAVAVDALTVVLMLEAGFLEPPPGLVLSCMTV